MKKFLTLTMLGFLAITILGCGSSKAKIPSKALVLVMTLSLIWINKDKNDFWG